MVKIQKKRLMLSAGIRIMIMLIVLLCGAIASEADAASSKIVLQLRWNPQFQFAGYYAADWKGYFKEEGLDVEIRHAFTEEGKVLDAVTEVAEGRADFGIGAVDVLIAENKGAGLSVVSSLFQRSAVEFYYKSDKKLNSILDFAKLNAGRREHDLLDIEYQAMLISEGIIPGTIGLLPANREFTAEDLSLDRYDVIPGYLGTIDYLAKKQGLSIKHIKPSDYGIDFYGDSLFTSSKLAEKDPLLVEKFRRACLKGWEYALEHPGELAYEISRKFKIAGKTQDELLDYNRFQAGKVKELTLYPVVQLGNINPYRWEKMQDMLVKLELVVGKPDFNKFIFSYNKIVEEKSRKNQRLILELSLAVFLLLLTFLMIRLASKNTALKRENEERKRAEEKIRRSTQRYQTMFSSAELGITVTQKDGTILQVNRKWLEMTGYSEREVVGGNIADFVLPGDDKAMELRDKYTDGEIDSYTIEQQYIRKDGSLFWGRLYLTLIFDQDSDEMVNMGMVLDINSDKIEEEAVRRSESRFRNIINEIASGMPADNDGQWQSTSNDEMLSEKGQLALKLEGINLELERMFKHEMDENRKKEALLIYQARLAAMGEMIANIAHQWRQPLNMLGLIISNIKDAYEYGELEPSLLDSSVQRSRRLIGKMSDTIDDFRFFLNPKTDKAAFSVEENIKTVLELLEENLKFHKIETRLDTRSNDRAFGYANQYSQAIFNIIGNSIDAICENQIVNGKLDIVIYKSGKYIVTEISDNGGGIAPEIANRIFDMHFTTKQENKGTGLGLYMTRLIIESNLKGKVELVSHEGGVTMKVSVPVCDDCEMEETGS